MNTYFQTGFPHYPKRGLVWFLCLMAYQPSCAKAILLEERY